MFHTYAPYASSSVPRKGLSLATDFRKDVETARCGWFYDWGRGNVKYIYDPKYVPMLWNGSIDRRISRSYGGYILHLNEPENTKQANKTPQQGFDLYRAAVDYYPAATIVTGGLGSLSEYWGWTHWLEEFIGLCDQANYPVPLNWHFHGYVESFRPQDAQYNMTLENVLALWDREIAMVKGSNVWITEYGDPTGNIETTKAMTEYCLKQFPISHFCVFSNRFNPVLPANEYPPNWPFPPVMGVIDNNGNLTALGQYYADIS